MRRRCCAGPIGYGPLLCGPAPHGGSGVKLGERTIGFLLTGQLALDLPSPARFEAIVRQLTQWRVSMDSGTGWRKPTTDPVCFRRTNTLVSSAFWKS
jgi:hypothetical protein